MFYFGTRTVPVPDHADWWTSYCTDAGEYYRASQPHALGEYSKRRLQVSGAGEIGLMLLKGLLVQLKLCGGLLRNG